MHTPRHLIVIVPAAVAILFATASLLLSDKRRHEYMGNAVCANCHSAESIGNQYDQWLRSPHAKAVLILKTEDARKMAQSLDIEKPDEDPRCLRCHTTGGGAEPKTIAEGVGCEACHGPGGAYHEYANHVDTVNRRGGYETALKNGMYPILGISSIKKREKLCLRCHNSKRPCFPVKPEEIYRQSISLQTIAEMKKGDLNLGHRLIPPFPQY
ncbi:MAG: hypothetical protein JW838_07965 [Spirochaetes bacterium]|nr:hypothetical protein [Spirochaetota bacterium]